MTKTTRSLSFLHFYDLELLPFLLHIHDFCVFSIGEVSENEHFSSNMHAVKGVRKVYCVQGNLENIWIGLRNVAFLKEPVLLSSFIFSSNLLMLLANR